MQEFQPPQSVSFSSDKKYLFLAGSIEEGVAETWQQYVVDMLQGTEWQILNPRRNAWDDTWEQDVHNHKFAEQVTWELEGLERADVILLYFDPKTRSPISLLELGLFARSEKLIVVCPGGFWRKGNVDIVCERYGVMQKESLDEALRQLL